MRNISLILEDIHAIQSSVLNPKLFTFQPYISQMNSAYISAYSKDNNPFDVKIIMWCFIL